MFGSLSERLQSVFAAVRRDARLTPEAVESALREIRLALLEADVNFKVVRAFIDRVRDRAVDRSVLESLTPTQQVVAIVRDELRALLGDGEGGLRASRQRPRVVLLLGLQGAGKTTTTVKLAKWLERQGRHALVVSTDVRRPAAIEQLRVLADGAGIRVHEPEPGTGVAARAAGAVESARSLGFDEVLVDTAGRLHVADELMRELETLKAAVEPSDLLYVADAMTGQDAIKSAGEFNRRIGIDGVVLTKMDGDARGGAALSVVSVVGVPVTFVGDGERIDDLHPFHPDRLVSRMLGMGDVLSLVEKAEQVVSRDEASRLERKISRNDFTLQDMRDQLTAVKRMGPLDRLLELVPGMAGGCADARRGGSAGAGPHHGHHRLDDPARAVAASDHQRQPPAPHRPRQRNDGPGRQSPPETVHGDAPHAALGRRRIPVPQGQARPADSDHAAGHAVSRTLTPRRRRPTC